MIKRNTNKPIKVIPPTLEEEDIEITTHSLLEYLSNEETISHLLFEKNSEIGIATSYKSIQKCEFRGYTLSQYSFRSFQLSDIRFVNPPCTV